MSGSSMSSPQMENDENFDQPKAVPDRIWHSESGSKIRRNLEELKASLKQSLHGVDLFFNAGHIPFVNGEVLDGVNLRLRHDTLASDVIDHLQPLYQIFCVFDLGDIPAEKIKTLDDGLLKEIVDPEESRDEESAKREDDLVESYQKSKRGGKVQWYARIGLCNAYVMIFKESEGKYSLIVSGGHPQLYHTMIKTIKSDPKYKIHDLVDKDQTSGFQSALGDLIKTIKRLQYVNHCVTAKRVKHWLETGEISDAMNTSLEVDLQPDYYFYYNTVHQSFKDVRKFFIVSQGVLDVQKDIVDNTGVEEKRLYVVTDPRHVNVLRIKKGSLFQVHYFPISTGYSESIPNTHEVEEVKKRGFFEKIQVAGITNFSAVWKAYYQPFDDTLEMAINNLLAPVGWVAVSKREVKDVVAVITNGFDSSSFPPEKWLEYLSERPLMEKICVPVTSSIANLVRDTYKYAVMEFKKAGKEMEKLERVIEQSVIYPGFAWIAKGAVELSIKLRDRHIKTQTTAVQYGRPRQWA